MNTPTTGAGNADTAEGKAPGWWSRQRGDLLRDAIVTGVFGLLLLLAAVGFDNHREDQAQDLAKGQALRAEVLENTRFVRQAVMDPSSKLKPFARLNLQGASLASLPLGCTKVAKVAFAAWEGCADLTDADLTDADLTGADLTGAHLTSANLTSANLTSAHLTSAHLHLASLRDAHLTGAHLSGADLNAAHLYGADLYGAHLNAANLTGADLTGAILAGANLTRANLHGANLTRANLIFADLTRADLTGANLTGADLNDANLNDANLSDICYDVKTLWPERFEPPLGPEC